MRLTLKGGLHFFFTLSKALSHAHSVLDCISSRPNSLFTLNSLQHHVHIRHRRDYDEQKAVVVVS